MTETHVDPAPTYEEAPELFDGVLSRRLAAFIIDAAIISVLTTIAFIVTFLLGFLTLGLAWLLFGAIFPIIALLYTGSSVSGPESATIGMRSVGLEMRSWDGKPMTFLHGVIHALVFWVSFVTLTPFILLVGLLNSRGRLFHDFMLGTYVINSDSLENH